MRTDWRLIFLLYVAGLLAAAQFAKISLTLPALELRYPGFPVAYLVSALSLMGMAFGVTAGVVVARIGVRRVLLAGLFAGAVLSLVEAALPAAPLFLALRVAEGAAHLAIVVAAPTLMAIVATQRDKPVAMGLWGTFFGVGFALSALAVPLLTSPQTTYFGHGAALALLALALLPVLPRGLERDTSSESLLARHRIIYTSGRLTAPGLGFFFHTVIFLGLLTYLPGFLGAWTAPLLPLTALFGTFGAGLLARRFSPTRIVRVGLFLAALAMLLLVVVPSEPRPLAAVVVFAVMGLVAGASFAAVPYLNMSPADQARANGALAQIGNVGTALSTPLFAMTLGHGVQGPLVLAGAISLGGLFVMTLVHRRLREGESRNREYP
ncbi:MAG: MFS transporter [Pseudomonadota bacterium]